MKIYVDELPNSCEKCPFYKLDTYVDVFGYQTNSHECVLDGSMLTNSCPLHSLSDHDKQVRKDVCEELGRKITMIAKRHPNHNIGFDCEDIQISYLETTSVLDQIQDKGE